MKRTKNSIERQIPLRPPPMKISKFTKLPIEIEAVQMTEKFKVVTREGTIYGDIGDWLLTGVEGEKYPCSDVIFKKTYYPSGPDKCDYCEYGGKENRPCDVHEICTFKWLRGEQ